MKTAVVFGAGGFIGSHLVKFLRQQGYWVRGVDIKPTEFSKTHADDFVLGDLRDPEVVKNVLDHAYDEVYQLAADMGGAGYLFTGENDANVMHNSVLINLNTLHVGMKTGIKKYFYSSSACVYPEFNQMDPDNPNCEEGSVYPAQPDSEYGWEKLFSERLYYSFMKNHGIDVKVARFHNIFGEEGTWTGGKEKAPAAICRKVAEAHDGGEIEIWGDGQQTRSFLHVEECVEGVFKFMQSDLHGPFNIGSDEMVTINQLAEYSIAFSGKKLRLKHIEGPIGVRGRCSDNRLIKKELGWAPSKPLKEGLSRTFKWINEQVRQAAEV